MDQVNQLYLYLYIILNLLPSQVKNCELSNEAQTEKISLVKEKEDWYIPKLEVRVKALKDRIIIYKLSEGGTAYPAQMDELYDLNQINWKNISLICPKEAQKNFIPCITVERNKKSFILRNQTDVALKNNLIRVEY